MKRLSLVLTFCMVVFNLHLHAQCFTCDNIIDVAGASNSGNVSTGCKPSPAGSNTGCQGYRIDAMTTPAILPGATMFYETGNGGACSTGGQSSVFVEVDGDCTPPTPMGVGEVSTSGTYSGTLVIPAGAAEVIVYVCRSTGGGNPNLCNISMVGTTSVTSTPLVCQNDGTITAVGTITGQLVGTITYSINGVGGNTANTTGVFTGLPAGNYTVTVYDSGNTSHFDETTVTVDIGVTAPVVTAAATAALCNGGNGTITMTVANGTAPFDYVWDGPGANDGSVKNVTSVTVPLPAGSYAITATDANMCETTTNIIVTEPAALTATATATAALCNGGNGQVTLTIAGGTAPYDIAWNGPGANDGTANNQASGYMITALPAGSYAITVTDDNGCVTTTMTTVGQPVAALTATASSTPVSCNGGSNGTASVVAAGGTPGYTYNWVGTPTGDGTTTITGLAAGTYTVTVTDANGCMTTTMTTVGQPVAALTATASSTPVSCNGGSNGTASVVAAGGTPGYSYNWVGTPTGDGTANITGLAAGTYTVTVTDANGCMTTTMTTVGQPVAALTATASSTPVSCNGGSNGTASVTASGGTPGYTYNWEGTPTGDGTANITGLAAGTYTVTVTDANGCMTTTSTSVGQPDLLVVTCPPNATRCAGDAPFALTGGDPAGGTYSGTGVTAGIFDPSAAGVGVHTINYIYTNGNGCTDDCDFTVEVLGDCCTGPIAECKPVTVTLIGSTVTVLPADVDNGSTADCGLTCLSVLPSQFDCSHVGTPQTVMLKVSDINGDMDVCQATVTVLDPTPPMIACPANIVRSTDPGQCSAVVSYANPVFSDNCGVTLTLVSGLPSGSIFPKGVNMVNWKATDASGNMTVCGFTVTVNDTQAPTITCPPNIVKNTDPGRCDAVVTYAAPIVSDNCTGATSAVVPPSLPSGSVFPKGPNAVTWEATDGAGLKKRCTFTVTVNDNQPPTITCPSNQAKNTDLNMCSAVVAYTLPATTDNCSGVNRTLISGLASGSAFPKGITMVIWKATDGSGLTKTCSFRVTVTDAQAPTASCPSSVVKSTDNNLCSAITAYTTPTFTDNCAGGSIVKMSGLASGSAFPKGTSLVVWKATDAVGNTKTCSFTVTVKDMQLPGITCPADIVKSNDPGVCYAAVSYPAPTGTDNCPGVTVGILSGLASYSVFPIGINEVVWKATDASGGTKTCAFKVTVNDTEPPMIMCPGNTTVNGGGTPCTYLFASLPGATYMENCPGTVLTHNAPANLPSGTTTVTWTATDQANNQSQCAYQVTVQCGTNPSGGSALEARNAAPGTPDAQVQIDLQLAPNPATTAVTAMLSGVGEHGGELLLFDPLGRMVLQQKVAGGQQTVSLDLNSLGISSGLYQVSLRTESGVVTKGLIINRL